MTLRSTTTEGRSAVALERELETYQRERDRLIAEGQVGRWIVIHGEDIVGVFDDAEKALAAGYDRFGPDEPFLVRQIAEADYPIHTTRTIRPCRP